MLKKFLLKNKLIQRQIKQDVSHFQYFQSLFDTCISGVLQWLLNGKLRCVLICTFIYLGTSYGTLETEKLLLKIWGSVPFYKIAMMFSIITVTFGVLAFIKHCAFLPCGSHTSSKMGIIILLLPVRMPSLRRLLRSSRIAQ